MLRRREKRRALATFLFAKKKSEYFQKNKNRIGKGEIKRVSKKLQTFKMSLSFSKLVFSFEKLSL